MDLPGERLLLKEIFSNTCKEHDGWKSISANEQDTIIRRMERSCFGLAHETCKRDGISLCFMDKKFNERYSLVCNKVLANLYKNGSVSNNYLINKLIAKDIDPYDIANLSSIELYPQASEVERNEIKIRQEQKVPKKVSRIYTCSKCRNNETIYQEYQARSSDEASTKSIKCVHCDHVWRH